MGYREATRSVSITVILSRWLPVLVCSVPVEGDRVLAGLGVWQYSAECTDGYIKCEERSRPEERQGKEIMRNIDGVVGEMLHKGTFLCRFHHTWFFPLVALKAG